MLRAPEVEALYGGYALIEPRDPRGDGSTVLLVGSTAFPRSLLGHIAREVEWGKSPDATGSKPFGSRSKAVQNKRRSATINDHRETSGNASSAVCGVVRRCLSRVSKKIKEVEGL